MDFLLKVFDAFRLTMLAYPKMDTAKATKPVAMYNTGDCATAALTKIKTCINSSKTTNNQRRYEVAPRTMYADRLFLIPYFITRCNLAPTSSRFSIRRNVSQTVVKQMSRLTNEPPISDTGSTPTMKFSVCTAPFQMFPRAKSTKRLYSTAANIPARVAVMDISAISLNRMFWIRLGV